VRVLVFPADRYGCGYHRLIWPALALQAQGHDVRIQWPEARGLTMDVDVVTGEVVRMDVPKADVIVMQRPGHRNMVAAIAALRKRGVAVVVDVDDDLNNIHPKNPAWELLHPRNMGRLMSDGTVNQQSWKFVERACQLATLVTVSTPALVPVYGRRGATHVLYNRLHDSYFAQAREDNDHVVWPASYHSHPDDPYVTKDSLARVVADGADFSMLGDATGAGRAFKLDADPRAGQPVDILDWPACVATAGIGIAPAADTVFNQSKSWLKPLEMSAVGVPWVASPIVEYQRLYDLGAGVLAKTPDEWYAELTRLRTDVAWRQELSDAGREVAALHRLEDHAWRWWEAWDLARRIQRGQKVRSTAVL
jgi:hypothetical protein